MADLNFRRRPLMRFGMALLAFAAFIFWAFLATATAEPQPAPEPAEPVIDYTKLDSPMGELLQAVEEGDIVTVAQKAREVTQFHREDPVILMIAAAMLITAISGLIRRTGEAAKPIIEAAGENMKRDPKQ